MSFPESPLNENDRTDLIGLFDKFTDFNFENRDRFGTYRKSFPNKFNSSTSLPKTRPLSELYK